MDKLRTSRRWKLRVSQFLDAIKLIDRRIFALPMAFLKSEPPKKQARLLIYPTFHSNLLNLFSLQGLSVSMPAIGRADKHAN